MMKVVVMVVVKIVGRLHPARASRAGRSDPTGPVNRRSEEEGEIIRIGTHRRRLGAEADLGRKDGTGCRAGRAAGQVHPSCAPRLDSNAARPGCGVVVKVEVMSGRFHLARIDGSKEADEVFGQVPAALLQGRVQEDGGVLPAHRHRLHVLEDDEIGGGQVQLLQLQASLEQLAGIHGRAFLRKKKEKSILSVTFFLVLNFMEGSRSKVTRLQWDDYDETTGRTAF